MRASQIKELRESLGMSQTKFAQHLGVKGASVSCWENARYCPDAKHIKKLKDLAKDKTIILSKKSTNNSQLNRAAVILDKATNLINKAQDIILLAKE